MKNKLGRMIFSAFAFIIMLIGGKLLLTIYPDYLWFQDIGYTSAFWVPLFSKSGFFILFALASFIFIAINLLIAKHFIFSFDAQGSTLDALLSRLFKQNPYRHNPMLDIVKQMVLRYTNLAFMLVAAIVSLFIGGAQGMLGWDTILAYVHQAGSTVVDPIFHRSVSFYFFSLPFYSYINNFALVLLLITFGGLLFLYFQLGLLNVTFSVFKDKRIKAHLLILGALFFVLLAIKFWLARYGMLIYSSGKLFHGPGYTDIHAGLLSYFILSLLSLVTGVILLFDMFIPNIRPVFLFISALIVCGVFFGGIVPGMMQKFVVSPNEYQKEKQYLQHNIDFTRKAYNLEQVSESFFPATEGLNSQVLKDNKAIIDNIRVWDEAPMLKTLSQLQSIRLYYEFPSVDVDRYDMNGKEQQVLVAARELNGAQLSDKAQNWVNRKLQYTHGYGIVMSPVNTFTEDGMPNFYLKDIPPVSTIPLKIERPELYYGEKTDDYVIVNTSLKEFDYPKGDDNQFSQYAGERGIRVDSLLNRALFALKFKDTNILLTSYIKDGSRILYDRNIITRVKRLAPFLTYDSDPYIVAADGRLFWVIDAYTVSSRYPYSQPYGRINYIRNPVKITVDAYDGSVKFYLIDETDPLISTYARIYKNMFEPFDRMPSTLKAHIRTPRDYFTVQAFMYRNYHMTNPQVFYNQEDVWEIPKEKSEDSNVSIEPYYITMRLPGENKFEFLNMIPFVPANKNNLVSWLVAKNSPTNYGKLMVYKLTKDRQIYGPMQIESMIDQDTQISQQLTLWGQKGSTVIRGNLLIIPIENSLLYVEPIYLQSTSSKLPQLKRVIVAYGDNVVMEEDLEKAINRVFGAVGPVSDKRSTSETPKPGTALTELGGTDKTLAKEALTYYEEAQNNLRAGKWAAYGDSVEKLSNVLRKLAK